MKSRARRSTGVTTSLTVPRTARPISGDLDFDALYRATRDDLYAYVATVLRDPQAAEDVTALAFERAMRRQRSYRPGRGTPRAWLFGIARNAALDDLRRRRRSAVARGGPARRAAPSPQRRGRARRAARRRARRARQRSSRATARSSP